MIKLLGILAIAGLALLALSIHAILVCYRKRLWLLVALALLVFPPIAWIGYFLDERSER